MGDQSLTEAVQTLQTAVEAMKADQDELRQMFRPMKGTPAGDYVSLAAFHLTGVAQMWHYRLEMEESELTWPQFKQRCYLRFGPGLRSNALGFLVKLNQGGRPVEVYNDDFQSALLCTSTVRQDQVVDLYTAGLDDWLRIDVEHQRPQNLDVAMNFARSYSRQQLSVPEQQPVANVPFSSSLVGRATSDLLTPSCAPRFGGPLTACAEGDDSSGDNGPDPSGQQSGPFEHEHEGALILKAQKFPAPLTSLLRKHNFVWTEEATAAFQALKIALTSAPVLQLPDFSKPFVVECDASGVGVGAVLHQDNHPVAFFSRRLTARHHKLASYEQELIGLSQAIRHWRHYLWGCQFIVRTDHYSLKFLLQQRLTTSPQHHWISKLLGYDFDVEFRAGRLNTVADALSRRDEEVST
nr:putative retroelement protein [Ipomoea batatas]